MDQTKRPQANVVIAECLLEVVEALDELYSARVSDAPTYDELITRHNEWTVARDAYKPMLENIIRGLR